MAHIEIKASCDDPQAMQERIGQQCGAPVAQSHTVDFYFQPTRPQAQTEGFLFKIRTQDGSAAAQTEGQGAQAAINPDTGETRFEGAAAAERYAQGELVVYSRAPLDEAGQRDTRLSVLTFGGQKHAQLTSELMQGGYYLDATVRKHRALYERRDEESGLPVRIHLDEVQGLGPFVEIECKYNAADPAEKSAAAATVLRLKQQLAIPDAAVVSQGYAALSKAQEQARHPELLYPLLAGLSEPLRQQVATAPRRRFEAGTTLLLPGPIERQEDKKAYVILSGAVGIYRGAERLLTLGPGDTVGELYALNPDQPKRTGKACALEPCEMIELSDALLHEMYAHPRFLSTVLAQRVYPSLVAAHDGREPPRGRG